MGPCGQSGVIWKDSYIWNESGTVFPECLWEESVLLARIIGELVNFALDLVTDNSESTPFNLTTFQALRQVALFLYSSLSCWNIMPILHEWSYSDYNIVGIATWKRQHLADLQTGLKHCLEVEH